jgi:hypothetical protein
MLDTPDENLKKPDTFAHAGKHGLDDVEAETCMALRRCFETCRPRQQKQLDEILVKLFLLDLEDQLPQHTKEFLNYRLA